MAKQGLRTTAEIVRLNVKNADSSEWFRVATACLNCRVKTGLSQPLCQRRQLTVTE